MGWIPAPPRSRTGSTVPAPTRSNAPSDPPLPAAIGRYEIVRVLGEGAMGRVLLARDPVLDREVAIKHLRGDLKIPREVREGLLKRMRHEARAAARVPHPNLVVLHDMGEDPEVGLYLVFEYVQGPTLKQRIAEGRLPPAEAAKLATELGSALTTAHAAGILHRDVKPENVMLASTGGKVADFGIARIPDSTLTHQGGLMGTPAYSAPETFRGGRFSPLSDQFSLAASLYEAISGRRAFPGDDAVTVAAAIAHDDPEPFAARLGLPPSIDEVLGRALSRRAEDRYPSCEALGAAIAASLTVPTAASRATPIAASLATPAPSADASTTTQVLPMAGATPRERRTGQVLLGAALVVATSALVLRTALRSVEADPKAAPRATVTATAPKPPRPRAPAAAPVRTARPHEAPTPSATTSASAAPTSAPDAGAMPSPGAPVP